MGEKEAKKPLHPSLLFRNKKHNNEPTGVHCAGALSAGFRREGRSGLISPQPSLFRVTCRESPVSREAQVATELRRESERRGSRKGYE